MTSVLLFHVASLLLFVYFTASTVTLEREEQVADRIVAITRLIEHANAGDRAYLARELSSSSLQVTVGQTPFQPHKGDITGGAISELIRLRTVPFEHVVVAEYADATLEAESAEREITSQRLGGLFRIHQELLVSIDLPEDSWLNFRVSGSPWDHIFSLDAIPSLTLMALGTIALAAWAMTRPLRSLSVFAMASESMRLNVQSAQPIPENGPRELRESARAFNLMQQRVQRLLQARNQMLGAISHDFRTPLTRLRLRIEGIGDEVQRDKAVHDLEEMEAMLGLALAYARDETAEEPFALTDLDALTREVVDDLLPTAKAVTVDVPQPISIVCQPIGTRRMLANIIDNALFHSEKVHVCVRGQDGGALIEVDDSGPGIKPEDREKVFIPFLRLEPSRNRKTGGAGLGLSIVQMIVDAHGGSIKLMDSPLGGLRVSILLPKAQFVQAS